MSRIWHTSDTHFGHAKVAQLRGFTAIEEHDDELVRRWNATVGIADIVWHHGDFAMHQGGTVGWYRGRLNGRIRLITGNHDACWPGHRGAHRHQRDWIVEDGFESVQAFAHVRIRRQRVMLSHFPYAFTGDHTAVERHSEFRLPNLGEPLLHGHVHAAWKVRGLMVNVGVDVWDLAPVAQETVAELLADAQDLQQLAKLGTTQ